MTLPFPTGVRTNFEETDDIYQFKSFLERYYNLLTLDIKSVDDINRIKQFLSEVKQLKVPSEQYYPQLVDSLHQNPGLAWININHIPTIIKTFKNLADNHNLYFDSLSGYNLTIAVNNFTMHSMYNIIVDPVNLIQAHTSVDGTTGPLKEVAKENTEEERAAKTRTPGNFINKYESIIENQVGKESIGICAVGLKSFFALTQYNNYILNYGTAEQQERLLFGSKHKGITFNSIIDPHSKKQSVFKTLANIRSKDPNTITNNDVLEALASVTNDNDAALVLSALLSLATDNAKELTLSKLNAGTKMIGMYIYGISIGMDFRDIAKILMSDVGITIANLLNSDVFSERNGYSRVKYLFDYFDKGPGYLLNKFDVTKDSNGNLIQSPIKYLEKEFNARFTQFKDEDRNPLPFSDTIVTLAKDDLLLDEKLEYIEQLRNLYNSTSQEAKEIYNQALDFVQDYIQQAHLIKSSKGVYEDIKTLAEGGEEMRRLGQMVGLNQGIKTSSETFLNQINLVERAIYDITGDLNDMINLHNFVFDEEYRNKAIQRYEEVKHTFNILDVVASVPHFMGYLQTLDIASEELRTSFKFRSIKNLSLELTQKYNKNKEADVVKGLQNFIGDYIRKQWMLNSPLVKPIVIPNGNKIFNQNGELIKLNTDATIQLGTQWGDASFKMWMENDVIPNLKAGKIDPDLDPISAVLNNEFIKDLGNELFTHTVIKNPSIIYALPINMLPRTDNEQSILNNYKTWFNELIRYPYIYTVEHFDDNGNVIKDKVSIPILDLFTYYAMIAHNWKLGEKSLVPILGDEQYQNSGLIKDFHEYVGTLDLSGETLSLEDSEMVTEKEIIPYIIPYGNPYSSFSSYIVSKDPETKKRVIMIKSSNDDSDIMEGLGIDSSKKRGHYESISQGLDTNYFPTSSIEQDATRMITSKDITIEYDVVSKRILSLRHDKLSNEDASFIINELRGIVPVIKQDTIPRVNFDLLEILINNKLNPCT